MDTILISILITLAALIIFVASHKLGEGIKSITRLFLVIIVVLAIISVLIFNDMQDLKRDITQGKNIFILKEEDAVYAAVGIKPTTSKTFDFDSFEYYNASGLGQIIEDINSGKESIGGSDRAFIITPKAINKSYTLDFGVTLDENDLLQIIESNDTYQTMAQKLSTRNEISKEYLQKNYGDPSKIKGYILAALIVNYFQNSAGELSTDFKSGAVKIHPETISFKVLKYLPLPKLE